MAMPIGIDLPDRPADLGGFGGNHYGGGYGQMGGSNYGNNYGGGGGLGGGGVSPRTRGVGGNIRAALKDFRV